MAWGLDVIVEFAWGTNMDFASLDLREKLDLGNLPREASQPILLRFDPSLDPIMRIALHGNVGLMEMRPNGRRSTPATAGELRGCGGGWH